MKNFNNKQIAIYLVLIFAICYCISGIINKNKTYSFKCDIATAHVKDINGNKELYYTCDANDGNEYYISNEDAVNIYGERRYQYVGGYYFKDGKEIDKNTYTSGRYIEDADIRAKDHKELGIRVHSTNEFKNKIDDIFNNHKLGDFFFEFAINEPVNFDEVLNYYKSKYGVLDVHQNFYKYDVKGDQEPNRTVYDKTILDQIKNNGEFELDTTASIRISSSEKELADRFVNELIPYISGDGSDYQKIYGAAYYISKTTHYIVDDGFFNDLLNSNTSLYDALIKRGSVCIGFSITFSYLMDKMGIESYIVDDITYIDDVTGSFESVHSHNLVKLDGKFYNIDITGGDLSLTVPNGLSSNNLNLATSNYTGGNKFNVDLNAINNIWNKYSKQNPSTTNIITTNSSTKNASNIDVTGNIVEKSSTSKKTTNTYATRSSSTRVITSVSSNGDIVTSIITENTDNISDTTDIHTFKTSEIKVENKDKKNSITPLLIIGGIAILFLIIYELFLKNKIGI